MALTTDRQEAEGRRRPDTDREDAPLDLDRFLRNSLLRLRWVTLVILLPISFMSGSPPTDGLPAWALVVIFAAYSFLADLLGRIWPLLASFANRAVLDMLVASGLYFLSVQSNVGGPIFVLFFLAVDYAAASLTIRGTLFYTLAVAIIVAIAELVHMVGSMSLSDAQSLATQLLMLALVGIGMAIVTRRLVMEQRITQRARGEADRLAELDRVRADFFSMISHELRTPLTATRASLGMVETSALDRLKTEEWELLENARRNTERLNILIDDLLVRNQLEAGTLRINPELLLLRDVIKDAVSVVESLLREKQQALEISCPPGLAVRADPRRLQQALVNILSNANRHTPTGTRIGVVAETVNGTAQLTISDNGPGIEPAALEAIFERFYRLPSSLDGSGLGLAIAKAVIEMQGGKLWAASQPGRGTNFYITLPLAGSEAQSSGDSEGSEGSDGTQSTYS